MTRADEAGVPATLMTLEQVSTYLGVSKRWTYEQARTGKLPALLIARTYRFRAADIEAFLDSCRVTPDDESA